MSQRKRGQMHLNDYVAITFNSSAPVTPDIPITHSKNKQTNQPIWTPKPQNKILILKGPGAGENSEGAQQQRLPVGCLLFLSIAWKNSEAQEEARDRAESGQSFKEKRGLNSFSLTSHCQEMCYWHSRPG